MSDGTLITFEGLDASGKSTLIATIADRLDDTYDITTVGEFSQSVVGAELRRLLTTDRLLTIETQSLTITSLLIADYFYQIENEIRPPMEDGGLVLKDRYIDTLRACQRHPIARDYGMEREAQTFLDAVEELTPVMPDLTIFLSVPHQELARRIQKREGEISDRDLTELARREAKYKERMKKHSDRFIVYENTEPEDCATRDVSNIIMNYLE